MVAFPEACLLDPPVNELSIKYILELKFDSPGRRRVYEAFTLKVELSIDFLLYS